MQAEEPGSPSAPGAQGSQSAPSPEPRLSSPLLPELYTFVARVLFYLAPVYLAGYLGLSITWLLLGALLWMWWRRNRRGKLGRLAAAFEFLDNERQFISRELRGQHLPAWVSRVEGGGGGMDAFGGSEGTYRHRGSWGRRSTIRIPGAPPSRAHRPLAATSLSLIPASWSGSSGSGELRFHLRAQSLGEKLRAGHTQGKKKKKKRAFGTFQSFSGGKQKAFISSTHLLIQRKNARRKTDPPMQQ